MEFSKNNLLQSLQVQKSQWYVIRIKIREFKIIAAIGTDDELWREILIAETFPALASVFNIVSNFTLILVTFHAKYYNNKYFLPISITFFQELAYIVQHSDRLRCHLHNARPTDSARPLQLRYWPSLHSNVELLLLNRRVCLRPPILVHYAFAHWIWSLHDSVLSLLVLFSSQYFNESFKRF